MALGEVSEINVQEIDSFEILEFNNLETMKRYFYSLDKELILNLS